MIVPPLNQPNWQQPQKQVAGVTIHFTDGTTTYIPHYSPVPMYPNWNPLQGPAFAQAESPNHGQGEH